MAHGAEAHLLVDIPRPLPVQPANVRHRAPSVQRKLVFELGLDRGALLAVHIMPDRVQRHAGYALTHHCNALGLDVVSAQDARGKQTPAPLAVQRRSSSWLLRSARSTAWVSP